MSRKNHNQRIYLGDSLESARRLHMPQVDFALPQHIENLRRVLMGKENDINARRAAYTALQHSAESAAADVLKEFAASGLKLSEPAVVRPTSPEHPEGVVAG
jgi:hypothetical protein